MTDMPVEPEGRRPATAVGSLIVFLVLVGAAASFGGMFAPGEWYESLRKPLLNPPSWVFPPVWTALYLCIAVAGWRFWRQRRRINSGLVLWGLQLVANAVWSFLFFGLQRPGLALLDILALLALIVATTLAFARVDRIAAALLCPYLLWVAFATYLNSGLWLLNRG